LCPGARCPALAPSKSSCAAFGIPPERPTPNIAPSSNLAFAGRAAQLDRAYAISAAQSLGDSMRQIGEAERRGEGQFRDNVTAQMRSRRT
jgi:hypothetical protein